jgi:hypothetical protein
MTKTTSKTENGSKVAVTSTTLASRFLSFLQPVLLPLLIAVFPSLFHYGNNANIVILPSLARMLLFYSSIAIISYLVALLVLRWQATKAANVAAVFLIFFNIYGLAYTFLLSRDFFRVTDYRLLPLFVLLAIYACWLVTKIEPLGFWKGSVFLFGLLVAFNLIKIVPAEIQKYRLAHPAKTAAAATVNTSANPKYPDVYFIIFDEMAGFDTMRNYWHYQGVDDFKNFLLSKGFFVAENSLSGTIDTLQLMSERLNYQEYPLGGQYRDTYYDAISNNRVMQYFKSIGYTTVVFDETKFGYPAVPSIVADTSFEYASSSVTKTGLDTGVLFDDFGILVADNTMLRAFPIFYNKSIDPMFKKHQDMVFFTGDKITSLGEIPTPKFVHVHLLLPHYPFMFNEDGSLNQPINFYNWNYYLGNYKFSIKLAEKMINGILESADPKRPPIIIFQSDHGARNIVVESRNGVPLKDFPEDYKHHIVNALYLPGFDTSKLPQDMKPIDTFPIILNHYFNTDIPVK